MKLILCPYIKGNYLKLITIGDSPEARKKQLDALEGWPWYWRRWLK